MSVLRDREKKRIRRGGMGSFWKNKGEADRGRREWTVMDEGRGEVWN